MKIAHQCLGWVACWRPTRSKQQSSDGNSYGCSIQTDYSRLLTTTTYYSSTTSAIQVQEVGLLLPTTGLPKFLIGIISVFHANFQWHMGFYMYYYLKAVFT
jgi:hypothetical protein